MAQGILLNSSHVWAGSVTEKYWIFPLYSIWASKYSPDILHSNMSPPCFVIKYYTLSEIYADADAVACPGYMHVDRCNQQLTCKSLQHKRWKQQKQLRLLHRWSLVHVISRTLCQKVYYAISGSVISILLFISICLFLHARLCQIVFPFHFFAFQYFFLATAAAIKFHNNCYLMVLCARVCDCVWVSRSSLVY